jgi:hypothetical protein
MKNYFVNFAFQTTAFASFSDLQRYVWLPRKTRRMSLGLFLTNEQKKTKCFFILFFYFSGWKHWWGPGDGQVKY